MSRHYQYTRLTDTRLNWPVGVDSTEVLIAEFRHDDGLPAQAEPSEANGFGGITVLIDLCKSVDSRNAFAAIAGALEFARTSWFVVNTSDLVDFLAKRVHELAADWIDVIIYAPDDKSEQVAEEQHRIDNIRAALQGSLGLLFIVTDSADQPNSLVRITAVSSSPLRASEVRRSIPALTMLTSGFCFRNVLLKVARAHWLRVFGCVRKGCCCSAPRRSGKLCRRPPASTRCSPCCRITDSQISMRSTVS
jgi:hypothetical protein